jgi:hypothetical protein
MKKSIKDALHKRVSEMNGLTELNMHKEAVELAKQILAEKLLDSVAFSASLYAIQIGGDDLQNLKDLIHAAYNRLPDRDRQKVRPRMLEYYHSINDMKTALEYVAAPSTGADLFVVMDILLANDRLDEAEKLFFQGKANSRGAISEFDCSMFFTAMARFCERTGRLNEAEQYWLQVSEMDQPGLREALSGLVKIQVVRAWKHLQHGLKQVEKFKTEIDPVTVVQLPGNHDKLLAEAGKEIESFREALDRIVPEKDLVRFGN